jgi:outer membrane lipoprotein-sorting protein
VSEYTLTPKPAAAVVWGKITLEVRQADLMPTWQRYYDENGKLVRELSFSDYAYVSGRLVPTRLVMRPLDQAGEQTTITYDNIAFDKPISEEIFSLKNLKP